LTNLIQILVRRKFLGTKHIRSIFTNCICNQKNDSIIMSIYVPNPITPYLFT